jgi:RNA polymerase sigma-70 factor (ECF subfamily)
MSVGTQTSKLIDELHRKCGPRLLGYLTTRTGSRQAAEDLAQETWSRMQGIAAPEQIGNPEGYLFKVADNLLPKYAHEQGRRRAAIDVDEPAAQELLAVQEPFDKEIDAAAHSKELHEALRHLTPRQHTAVMLNYYYDLSYKEIAEKMGVSTNTVKKFLKEGLAQLRIRMKEYGAGRAASDARKAQKA